MRQNYVVYLDDVTLV